MACCCLAEPHYEAAGEKAGLAGATGKVETGSAGHWHAAQVGDLLTPGQSVRTGPRSVAIVVLDDLTSLRLGASSELTIVSLQESAGEARLASGRAWVNANPTGVKTTFELRGPNAVAAVKGTSFEMSVRQGQTRVRVWEGLVACHLARQSQAELVKPGQEYAAESTQARVLANVETPDSWQRWNQDCDREVQVVALADSPPDAEEQGGGGNGEAKGKPVPPAVLRRPSPAITQARRSRLNKLFLQKLSARMPAPPPSP